MINYHLIRKIPGFSVVIAVAVLTVNNVYSQTDSLLTNSSLRDLLNMKVTTASKTSQMLETAPAKIMVITKEQIKIRGYQSLLDVMYDLPAVKVDDKMYSGMRNSFTVRGIQGSEKFILLLDGINISSPSGEALPIMENYPVHLAEQIEVVYGPASALYGANALSGVINIITKKHPSRKDFSVEASSAIGDHGYTNTTLFLTKKLGDQANIVISGQYFYDKGVDYSKLYKDDSLYNISSYSTGTFNTFYGPISTATPIHAAFEAPMEAYNIYGALNIHDFSLSFFRNYTNIPTGFSNNTSNTIYNKDVFMKQDVTMANFSYRKTFGKITSTTSMMTSEYNLNPSSNYRNLYTFMEKGYKYSTCTMRRIEEQLDYRTSDNLSFSTGIAIENYNATPQSGDLNDPVDRSDYIHASYLGTAAYYRPEGLTAQFYFIKYHNIGGYLQTQFSPSKELYFTLGARYDYNSRYGSTFNPRVGVVYKPSDNTTIKALYGSAYRAPSPSDAYSHYGSFYTTDSGRTYNSFFLHLPNPGLKPIKSYNGEVSIKRNITDNFILTIDGYYTFIKGLLQFSDDNMTTQLYNNVFNGTPVDYIEVFTNNNRQKTYGGTIQLDWKYSLGNVNLNSFASVSYVNGVFEKGLNESEETEKDTELDFISPFMFRIGVDGKINKFSFSPRLIIMDRQNIAGISDTTTSIIQHQTIPGYVLLNISMRYAFNKRFSVFTNIHNALNQKYKSVGFNMDLTKPNTDVFHGQREDPIRIMAGLRVDIL